MIRSKCATAASSQKLNSWGRTYSWSCHSEQRRCFDPLFLNSKDPSRTSQQPPFAPAPAEGPGSLTGDKDTCLWTFQCERVEYWTFTLSCSKKNLKSLESLINLPKGFCLTAEQESNLWKAEADILEKKEACTEPTPLCSFGLCL